MSSNGQLKWDREKTILLITHYETFPELWNLSLKEYRNKEKKACAVKKISEILEVPEQEITRKWHNLRCQMNSELRKIRIRKSSMSADDVGLVKSSWEYFDALHYMVGCIKPNEDTTANMVPNLKSQKDISTEVLPQCQDDVQDHVKPSTSGVGNALLKDIVVGGKIDWLDLMENVSSQNDISTDEDVEDHVKPSTSGVGKAPLKGNYKKRKVRNEEEETAYEKNGYVQNTQQDDISRFCVKNKQRDNICTFCDQNKHRDDISTFCDYVASELRQLRSDENRKKLKRIILKAILEVGEKEDIEYS